MLDPKPSPEALAIAIKISHNTLCRYRQPVHLSPHRLNLVERIRHFAEQRKVKARSWSEDCPMMCEVASPDGQASETDGSSELLLKLLDCPTRLTKHPGVKLFDIFSKAFVIEDGKIVAQPLAAKVTPKAK